MPGYVRRQEEKDMQSKVGKLLLPAHTRPQGKNLWMKNNKAEKGATVSDAVILSRDPVGQHNL